MEIQDYTRRHRQQVAERTLRELHDAGIRCQLRKHPQGGYYITDGHRLCGRYRNAADCVEAFTWQLAAEFLQ